MNYSTYYVKDGLINGEEGVYALTCGFGYQQADGWYYLPENDDDGYGPYETEQAAKDAAELSIG